MHSEGYGPGFHTEWMNQPHHRHHPLPPPGAFRLPGLHCCCSHTCGRAPMGSGRRSNRALSPLMYFMYPPCQLPLVDRAWSWTLGRLSHLSNDQRNRRIWQQAPARTGDSRRIRQSERAGAYRPSCIPTPTLRSGALRWSRQYTAPQNDHSAPGFRAHQPHPGEQTEAQ